VILLVYSSVHSVSSDKGRWLAEHIKKDVREMRGVVGEEAPFAPHFFLFVWLDVS